ncbi:MAG TPA: xanthine dehydrogenase family protein molybdopterin-binding subunit [Roseiflexaceae bacterium]|nr:xanthine dehydrogenase family protein molybdopterin-binding subunit [Roseiflexaceae bacterium]
MAYSSLIGARVKRKEDPRLITGKGNYVGDLKLPGMHHVAFVRSPYAHARIRGIDAKTALNRPGVVAVITGRDLPPLCGPMPIGGGEGGAAPDPANDTRPTHYALSIERARHVGEAVAAVIAVTPEIAADAAAEVVVDWEPLPAVVDMLKTREDGAPRLFEDAPNNIDHVWTRKRGDPDAAFASAHRVVSQRISSQRLSGVPMEGRAVVAAPDPTTDGLTVWTSCQGPHLNRGNLAKVLRMEENQIRVIAPDVGGGFGVKIYSYPEEILLAALAREYRMPLRWLETRLEHMATTTHGRAQVFDLEVAVQEDGTITGLRMRGVGDLGAYPVDPVIPDLTGMMGVGAYGIPSVDIEIACVYTNTTPVAAYRGAGRPEAAYYIERMIDIVADELGMDPIEVRRKNFIPPDKFPYKTPCGPTYDSGEYDKALTRALEISNYAALREEQKRRLTEDEGRKTNGGEPSSSVLGPSSLLGIGVACYVEMCGFGPYESAVVRVDPTGTVTVFTGISPHGQGGGTTFAQIIADELGVDFDKIVTKYGDTGNTPMGQGTMGSRSIAVGGSALVRAAGKVRDKVRQIAAHILEAAPEDIVLEAGHYQVKGVPARSLTLAEVAAQAYSDGLPSEIEAGLEATDFFVPKLIYPFGAHVAVVEVERETGIVRIREYYTVDDCGPRVSPMLVEGQVHGGLAQGIAQALLEEVVYDAGGQLLSGTLMDYAVPRADDFVTFHTDQTVTPTPHNPLGVKGIGEAATIGSTPAIANAVLDALSSLGVRHVDVPLRSEKVWRAIEG